MQGLSTTPNLISPVPGGLPDTGGCCSSAGDGEGFSQALNFHIAERFSAKMALADLPQGLQADAQVAAESGMIESQAAQPVVDVAALADLLAQMNSALQLGMQTRSTGPVDSAGMAATDTGSSAQALPGLGIQQNGVAAKIAADGKSLPLSDGDKGQMQVGSAKEAVPDFAQALASHGAEHSNRAEALAMVQARHEVLEVRHASQQAVTVEPRVGTPQWDGAVGQKVVWLIGQNQQSADLHLNPPHLGPLEVRLSMSGDGQTSVQFVSQHLVVREALESAVPRLREMLADNGIALGNVQVGAESFTRQQQADQRGHGEGAREMEGGEEVVTVLKRPFERNGLGVLDLFA